MHVPRGLSPAARLHPIGPHTFPAVGPIERPPSVEGQLVIPSASRRIIFDVMTSDSCLRRSDEKHLFDAP